MKPRPTQNYSEILRRISINTKSQTNTLTSLAILKVDIDEGSRDYVDYLSEFVVEALAIHRPQIVSDIKVVQLLAEEFGIRIPMKAVQHVLRRLAKKQTYLVHQDGAYFLSASMPAPSMGLRRTAAAQQIDSVVQSLCEFTTQIGVEPSWEPEKATEAIISFLGYFAIDCLRTHVFNTVLPTINESGVREHYIVGRFVSEAYATNRPIFESFIVFVKGQMYANALTCPDLQSLQQRFNTLTCFLDTPVLLNLLGMHGEANEAAALELVELIRNVGGAIGAFHHTFDETRGVIKFAIQHYQNLSISNRALRELRAAKKPISDLILLEANLEDRLKSLRVRVYDTPPYTAEYQIDEGAFSEALREEISYLGAQALSFDINSIRSIYVKRHGLAPSRLEDAVAVLVTSNSTFAKIAYEQGKEHNSAREVSPVITDYSLANVAWLKAPLKQPTLPERETLALCYAALEPSRTLLEKYVHMMDEMRARGEISANDHAILRGSAIAEHEMMGMTLGDDEALSHRDMIDILNKAKTELVSEVGKKHQEAMKDMELEQTKLKGDIALAVATAEAERTSREELIKKNEQRASKWAKLLVRVALIILSASLLVGAFAAGGLLPNNSSNDYVRWGLKILAVGAILWGWWSWHKGETLRGFLDKVEKQLKYRIANFLLPGS